MEKKPSPGLPRVRNLRKQEREEETTLGAYWRHSLHLFFFLIQGTEGAFANVPGPWSGPQASPALQRDTSKTVRGPAQQPLQDFPLRTPLTRGATALPFVMNLTKSCLHVFPENNLSLLTKIADQLGWQSTRSEVELENQRANAYQQLAVCR
ncbi:hypothetical protein D623_10004172 [Myotis brandtii]|uniref:Uncharacterized protein n=1 Tax=Myotis brandtii TaxID=109478 RepID=S7MHD4_MYOBR|nr:hypothetical protein D623_10004172 [Myotis brandtii]